jgi:hypothetical protein
VFLIFILFRAALEETSPLKPFLTWLEKQFEDLSAKLDAMKQKGVISFTELILLYNKGKKCYGTSKFREKGFMSKCLIYLSSF